MNKTNCNVIRDLLPLYVENVVSDDTRILVEKHLSECEACRNELKNMQLPIKLVVDTDASALKTIRKKWILKKIGVSIITSIIMILLFISSVYIYQLELPVKYSEVNMSTEEVTIQGGVKVFQVKVTGNNLEMVKVFSNFNDKSDAVLHYKIVRTTFLRNIFASNDPSVSIGVAEYWQEIDGFESTLVIEFEDKTVTYKNGIPME